jgi:hypothetical protein
MRLDPKLYLAAAAIWTALVILFPIWHGVGYLPDERDPSRWRLWGSFGLTRIWAPIWSPPGVEKLRLPPAEAAAASADRSDQPTVRWPWQRPSRGNHVELNGWLNLWVIGAGLAVLGLALHVSQRLDGRQPTLIEYVAWNISLSLAAAGVLAGLLIVITQGYVIEAPIVVLMFFGALALGVLLGAKSYRRVTLAR